MNKLNCHNGKFFERRTHVHAPCHGNTLNFYCLEIFFLFSLFYFALLYSIEPKLFCIVLTIAWHRVYTYYYNKSSFVLRVAFCSYGLGWAVPNREACVMMPILFTYGIFTHTHNFLPVWMHSHIHYSFIIGIWAQYKVKINICV